VERRRRIRGLRWWIITLVMVGTILNYLTRAIMGVAAPYLMTDLGIGTEEYSYIAGAFQVGIILQPVAGFLLDTIGLKLGLALFAFAWGGLTILHAFPGTWQVFVGLRGLLGFAEGTAHPGGLKAVSEWFPAKERGLAGGIYNIGASFGGVLAPPLVVFSIMLWDWRAAFIITGILAIAWALLWLACYQPPSRHPSIGEEERAYIEGGQEAHIQESEARPSIVSLLGRRNFWGIALPRFLADPTWGTLFIWMPLYLSTVRGLDIKQIALFAWLPFVAADVGCMFGPGLVLWLQKRGVTLINARRIAFTVGAVLMTPVMFVGTVESAYAAIALFCLAGFAHQTLSVTVITMASDLFRRNELGTVAGMAGTFANSGVLIFTLLIGAYVTTIGYEPFFIALGLLDLVAAAILWTVVKAPSEGAAKP